MKIAILLTGLLFLFAGCNAQPNAPEESKTAAEINLPEYIDPPENDNNTEECSELTEYTTVITLPENTPPPHRESGIMEIYVFGLANADAILITTENYVVMIDTGENQHGRQIVSHLINENICHIDYLIITHFDRDHVGGAHTLVRYLDVRNIIVPNYGKESRHVERLEIAMANAGLEAVVLTETLRFTLDEAEFVIYPSGLEFFFFYDIDDDEGGATDAPRENDFSIVVSVAHGENNFLFTGDAMAVRLEELLEIDEIIDTDFDFLKAPHHGRHNRRSVQFINAISPRYSVITCCEERPADERVVTALEDVGAEVYFSKHGDVHVRCDGHYIVVTQIGHDTNMYVYNRE